MSHLVRGLVLLGIICLYSVRAEAAVITFNLTGNSVGPTAVISDSTGFYSLTASGLDYSSLDLVSTFEVSRDAAGMGIASSNPQMSGPDSPFVESAGPNDRLRLSLGANSFVLVDVGIVTATASQQPLSLFMGGTGDIVAEESALVTNGVYTFATSFDSTTFDFASLSTNGLKLATVSFETGEPLPVLVTPEPASMLLLGTGLVGAGLRRWRRRA